MFDSLVACYRALADDAHRARATALLGRRHWLREASELDSRTGELLPDALSTVCARLQHTSPDSLSNGRKDRLFRVMEHIRAPLEETIRGLHEGLVRAHASLPLHRVRELDTSSFLALSRRPGRNVREKLAGQPYLWAVERRWTVDTAENRLIKALCAQLTELLEERTRAFHDADESWVEELRTCLDVWLRGAAEIGRWENLPPNNLLLQHRDYRRLWDAWCWTQTLEDDLRQDQREQLQQWAVIVFWSLVASLDTQAGIRLLEQPCYLDYEGFSITPGRTAGPALAQVEGLRRVGPNNWEPFVVELRAGGDGRPQLWLHQGDLPPTGIHCQVAGDRVNVRAGSHLDSSWSLGPVAAREFAEQVVTEVFGLPRKAEVRDTSRPAVASSPLCAVDLCTLWPRFATEAAKGLFPSRLLWQHWHPPGREPVTLDLGASRAIALGGPDVDTVSVLDLVAARPTVSVATLAQAARSMATTLREGLPGESLTYIVPDGVDEFTLGTLRRGINQVFRDAEPIPRSIAAAFEWHATPRFASQRVRAGDCLVVFDTVGESLSATLLIAARSEELAQQLPESHGIYWERCPTLEGDPSHASAAIAARSLHEMGCAFSIEIARLCGLQGLLDEGDGLSWQDTTGAWFTPPGKPTLPAQSAEPWEELSRQVERELGRLERGARVFMLLTGDAARSVAGQGPPRLRLARQIITLETAREPHIGALSLRRWQLRTRGLPLWCDRLPPLSIRVIREGRPERFWLVRQAIVQPRRGQKVPIHIGETFVLPAHAPFYEFPLQQGADGSELRYEAFLGSTLFPLAEDIEVTLELSYAYGSDTPYELVFLHRGRGLRISAEWRLRREEPDVASHYPTPPNPAPWSHFQKVPRYRSEGTYDLLASIDHDMGWVTRQLEQLTRERETAQVTRSLAPDRFGKLCTNVLIGSSRIFVHENYFVHPDEVRLVMVGTRLRMDVVEGNRGPYGTMITLDSGEQGDDESVTSQKLDEINVSLKRLRSRFLTVWADGHSLDETDVPDSFRLAMHRATETLREALLWTPPPDASSALEYQARRMSDSALFLLCCLHRGAPDEVPRKLLEILHSKGPSALEIRAFGRHVAFALGDGSADWQAGFLAAIVSLLKQEPPSVRECGVSLQLLGMALWQCPALLVRFSATDLATILERTIQVLEWDLERLSPETAMEVKDHLELVLALLRTRSSEDQAIRSLLTGNQGASRKIARLVEQIIDVVNEQNLLLTSHVKLVVEKPTALHRTPDLLYALQLYLTGNDGARAIQVISVRKDDDAL